MEEVSKSEQLIQARNSLDLAFNGAGKKFNSYVEVKAELGDKFCTELLSLCGEKGKALDEADLANMSSSLGVAYEKLALSGEVKRALTLYKLDKPVEALTRVAAEMHGQHLRAFNRETEEKSKGAGISEN